MTRSFLVSLFGFATLIFFSFFESAQAQSANESVLESTPDTPVVVERPVTTKRSRSTDIRASSEFTASYMGSIFGLAVPFKHGPVFGWIIDENWTIEASYFTGSLSFGTSFISVGSFSENLIAVQARYYPRNTFNWIFGFSRQSYRANLGSSLISGLSGGNIPGDVDVLAVSTIGLQIGFGNRWQWDNGFTLGVDWVVLNFPFQTLKTDAPFLDYVTNPNDRQTVEDVIRVMKFFPTGALTKVSLGYTF